MKHWRLIYLTIPLTVAVFAAILLANEWKGARPAQGVGSLTGKCQPVPEAVRYAAEAEAVEEEAAEYRLDSYTEGDGPAPEWWDPEEPMAAEWEASYQQVIESNKEAVSEENVITELATQQVTHGNEIQRTDAGCPDWNVDSTLYGWDGHTMEEWEMNLFSIITYLEFWGTSTECVEAGIDSMLLLWDMGEYGRTMGELLSAQYAPGYYVYSPYAYVWDWTYDAQALAEIRAMCEERFVNGPEWCAPYFRLWYYHEWAEPAYEIDGVYFSVPRG